MIEIFIIYETDNGSIKGSGQVDRSIEPDGSTMFERIEQILIKYPERSVMYFEGSIIPDLKLKKIVDNQIVDLSQDDLTEIELEEQRNIDIKTAQTTSGLAEVTVTQAEEWVTAKLMEAYTSVELVTNVATAKEAMVKILLAVQEINHKEMPYLLKRGG